MYVCVKCMFYVVIFISDIIICLRMCHVAIFIGYSIIYVYVCVLYHHIDYFINLCVCYAVTILSLQKDNSVILFYLSSLYHFISYYYVPCFISKQLQKQWRRKQEKMQSTLFFFIFL